MPILGRGERLRVSAESLRRCVSMILERAGVDVSEARQIAEVLTWTEMIGRQSHGVRRLPILVDRFRRGLIRSPISFPELDPSRGIHVVDGQNGFGQILGAKAMRSAVQLARRHGIGAVGVRHSNHFGAAGYYANLASEAGMLGMCFSNSYPRVVPPGGATPVVGTNPLAFSAPTRSGRAILVDMATSAVSGSAVRAACQASQPLAPGVAVDGQGLETRDSVLSSLGLLPIGGPRGFGLGLMVEILAALLTGSAISHEVGSIFQDLDRPNGVGHLMVALDPEAWMPRDEFLDRMDILIRFVKTAKPVPAGGEVLLPGEKRWREFNRSSAEGIELSEQEAGILRDMTAAFGAVFPC